MVYETLLAIGGLGFVAQLALGFAAHGSDHGHHAYDHGGGAAAAHHTEDTGAHQHSQHDTPHEVGHKHGVAGLLLGLLSPMTLFTLALGAGAAGMLLRPHLGPLPTAVGAGLGGLALYFLAVRPLQRLVLGFASKPAETLRGLVAREVEANARFDARGQGIVTATVDGQIVQLLARLEADDHANGMKVGPGDRLVVTSVDEQTGVCRVTRL